VNIRWSYDAIKFGGLFLRTTLRLDHCKNCMRLIDWTVWKSLTFGIKSRVVEIMHKINVEYWLLKSFESGEWTTTTYVCSLERDGSRIVLPSDSHAASADLSKQFVLYDINQFLIRRYTARDCTICLHSCIVRSRWVASTSRWRTTSAS